MNVYLFFFFVRDHGVCVQVGSWLCAKMIYSWFVPNRKYAWFYYNSLQSTWVSASFSLFVLRDFFQFIELQTFD
jgi:hypothetical protein